MKEILDFLTASPAFYVGTTDENNHPKVRPFSLVFEWNGKITFGTNETKKIHQQLRNNPFVEICSFNHHTGEWMRISGKVELFKNIDANRRIFEVMPALKDLYESENNPIIVCFSFIEGEASIYNFNSMNEPYKVIKL